MDIIDESGTTLAIIKANDAGILLAIGYRRSGIRPSSFEPGNNKEVNLLYQLKRIGPPPR